jgi:hypothetical protein
MNAITESYAPGDRYFDHHDLATFEDRDFYPDGRDLGENASNRDHYSQPRGALAGCSSSE